MAAFFPEPVAAAAAAARVRGGTGLMQEGRLRASPGALLPSGCCAPAILSQNGMAVGGSDLAVCCSMRRMSVAWWTKMGGGCPEMCMESRAEAQERVHAQAEG